MQPSLPNENGALPAGHHETVARRGRSHATITFALCEDGLMRYGLDMMYSYGGFSFPIRDDDPGFPSLEAARLAAIEELLRQWHRPSPSDPASVQAELRDLREQAEAHLLQPSLF
jgi:hypothetical protein